MDPETNESIRAELRRQSPDGDLVAMADEMRRMGIDSLLICRPGGRITRVVSEHRVRRLAQPEPQLNPIPRTDPDGPLIPEQVRSNAPSYRTAHSPEGEGVRAQTR